jgi:phage major head subunit gpT-like protein
MAAPLETGDRTCQRMALISPSSWDEESRTATVIISTDADVGDGVQLVHERSAIRWPMRPLPTDIDHQRSSASCWGAITSMDLGRTDDGATALIGTVQVDGPEDAMAIAIPRLRNGSARFSVDARIYGWQRASASQPLDRATDWEPIAVSLVIAGQDPASVMRSVESTEQPSTEPPMSTATELAGGDPAATATPEAAAVIEPTPAPAVTQTPEPGADDVTRELHIRRAAGAGNLPEATVQELIRTTAGKDLPGVMVEVVRAARLKTEAASPVAAGHPARIEVTRDAGDTLLRGITAGLQSRIRPGLLKGEAVELGREYRSYTLLELTREYLESRGTSTRGMSKTELVERGFHSTSDFPLLFSNLAAKSLDAAYEEEPHTWTPLARQRNLPDFKNASDLVVAGDLTPELLGEGGEYKAGTLKEAQHTWKLATYARKIKVTRQAIINDDLSALETVPDMLGRGFRRLESNIVWALITGNAVTSADGLSLFNSAHNNSSAQSITTAGFNAAKKAMRKQTDIAGNTINLIPGYMMVPTDLEATALQFLDPNGFMANARTGDNGPVTVQSAGVSLIVEPRLDGSATTWYLAASTGSVEGIVYGYLAGEEGPTVTTNEKRDPDGVELLARFDFGAAVKDFRGFFRAAAAS